MKTVGTKQILDEALKLEAGSELYLLFESSGERDAFCTNLLRQQLWLIRDEKLTEYEQVLISEGERDRLNAVILKKMTFKSAYIKKPGDNPVKIEF